MKRDRSGSRQLTGRVARKLKRVVSWVEIERLTYEAADIGPQVREELARAGGVPIEKVSKDTDRRPAT